MKMDRKRSMQVSLLMLAFAAGLLSQSLMLPVMSATSVDDQKNYYSPEPHTRSPPSGSHTSPSHGTPSHGSGGGYGHRTPSHGTPSHGGSGSYGGSPPANCGNPPSGGHYDPTPAPPTSGGHYNPTPAPPTSGGGGGYYNSPPPTYGGSPPSVTTPPTPIITTPPTPTTISPPSSPFFDPGTPIVPGVPSSPPFDPNSPPGTCIYWSTHPGLIWGLFGWFGTVGGAFGVHSLPGVGASMSLEQALSNTRTDGIGALYREGTASLLNSMVNRKFPYSANQVRDSFVAALSSDQAASAQAELFKLANEGHLKPKA